jgi:hypothetical protein
MDLGARDFDMNTLVVKCVAGAIGLTCVMVLALSGKVDGPTAAGVIQNITGVFLGGAAVLGVGQGIASAMQKNKSGEEKPS